MQSPTKYFNVFKDTQWSDGLVKVVKENEFNEFNNFQYKNISSPVSCHF